MSGAQFNGACLVLGLVLITGGSALFFISLGKAAALGDDLADRAFEREVMQAPDLSPVDALIGDSIAVEDADTAIRLAEKLCALAELPLTEADLHRIPQDNEWLRAHGVIA